ncbi:histidinol dehydrogenase, partial [Paracoccus sp. (in: a-proteobacteria)]
MAITYLKRGRSDSARAEDDRQTRETVEAALADIAARGDAAVRDMAAKFDGYTPESFRLSPEQIQELIATLTPREIEDIKFAQAQVRNFAQVQRDSMRDVEVETLPGVILGHKHIPVQAVGCY